MSPRMSVLQKTTDAVRRKMVNASVMKGHAPPIMKGANACAPPGVAACGGVGGRAVRPPAALVSSVRELCAGEPATPGLLAWRGGLC